LSPGDPFRSQKVNAKVTRLFSAAMERMPHGTYSLMVTNRKPHSGKGMRPSSISYNDLEEAKYDPVTCRPWF